MSGGVHGRMRQVKLRCEECGCESYIWRRESRLKEPKHKKHYWCRRCRERTRHVEVRED